VSYLDIETDNFDELHAEPTIAEPGPATKDEESYTLNDGPNLSGLRIGHLHICSLRNKTDQLKDIIETDKYHILAQTETHLCPSITD